jgi:hypothetical protein
VVTKNKFSAFKDTQKIEMYAHTRHHLKYFSEEKYYHLSSSNFAIWVVLVISIHI